LLQPSVDGGERQSSMVPIALAAVWLIWGSTYLGIRIGLETIGPFVLQAGRFVIASTLLCRIARRRGEPWPDRRALRNAAVIGVMLLIGFIVLAGFHGESLATPSGRSLAAMLYLATLGSVVAFSAYMYLVAMVRPSLAMSYAYVNPAIAVLLGALIADEVVTGNLLIALPIIILGVAIVTRSQAGSHR
jgi:drug/metabolite transporter (DMT)-like permease